MFCLRNQDITDAKAFFYLFFMSNSGYLNVTLVTLIFEYVLHVVKLNFRAINSVDHKTQQKTIVEAGF